MARQREAFSCMLERSAHMQEHREKTDAQMTAMRQALSEETWVRRQAQAELQELRTKFWDVLAGRSGHPWQAASTALVHFYPRLALPDVAPGVLVQQRKVDGSDSNSDHKPSSNSKALVPFSYFTSCKSIMSLTEKSSQKTEESKTKSEICGLLSINELWDLPESERFEVRNKVNRKSSVVMEMSSEAQIGTLPKTLDSSSRNAIKANDESTDDSHVKVNTTEGKDKAAYEQGQTEKSEKKAKLFHKKPRSKPTEQLITPSSDEAVSTSEISKGSKKDASGSQASSVDSAKLALTATTLRKFLMPAMVALAQTFTSTKTHSRETEPTSPSTKKKKKAAATLTSSSSSSSLKNTTSSYISKTSSVSQDESSSPAPKTLNCKPKVPKASCATQATPKAKPSTPETSVSNASASEKPVTKAERKSKKSKVRSKSQSQKEVARMVKAKPLADETVEVERFPIQETTKPFASTGMQETSEVKSPSPEPACPSPRWASAAARKSKAGRRWAQRVANETAAAHANVLLDGSTPQVWRPLSLSLGAASVADPRCARHVTSAPNDVTTQRSSYAEATKDQPKPSKCRKSSQTFPPAQMGGHAPFLVPAFPPLPCSAPQTPKHQGSPHTLSPLTTAPRPNYIPLSLKTLFNQASVAAVTTPTTGNVPKDISNFSKAQPITDSSISSVNNNTEISFTPIRKAMSTENPATAVTNSKKSKYPIHKTNFVQEPMVHHDMGCSRHSTLSSTVSPDGNSVFRTRTCATTAPKFGPVRSENTSNPLSTAIPLTFSPICPVHTSLSVPRNIASTPFTPTLTNSKPGIKKSNLLAQSCRSSIANAAAALDFSDLFRMPGAAPIPRSATSSSTHSTPNVTSSASGRPSTLSFRDVFKSESGFGGTSPQLSSTRAPAPVAHKLPASYQKNVAAVTKQPTLASLLDNDLKVHKAQKPSKVKNINQPQQQPGSTSGVSQRHHSSDVTTRHTRHSNDVIAQHVRAGRCDTCGMCFPPGADRYLVEEHVLFHHTFNN